MDKTEYTIIAERVQLPFVQELIAFIILEMLAVALFFLSVIAGLIVFVIFLLIGIFTLIPYYKNNHSENWKILYNDGIFIIEPIIMKKINKDEICLIKYKFHKNYIATPYFVSTNTYNYGKLYIYTQTEKIVIKNCFEPDSVARHINEICGLNKIALN